MGTWWDDLLAAMSRHWRGISHPRERESQSESQRESQSVRYRERSQRGITSANGRRDREHKGEAEERLPT